MFVADKKGLGSNVDKMAWDHLVKAGVIREPKARESKKPAPKKGRIGWKRLDATNKLGCTQCGGGGQISKASFIPYGMSLCEGCLKVHAHSIDMGLRPSDEVKW